MYGGAGRKYIFKKPDNRFMPKKNNPFAKLHIVNLKCVPCGNRKTDFKEKASDLKSAGSVPVNYTFWLLVLQLELEIFISPV